MLRIPDEVGKIHKVYKISLATRAGEQKLRTKTKTKKSYAEKGKRQKKPPEKAAL